MLLPWLKLKTSVLEESEFWCLSSGRISLTYASMISMLQYNPTLQMGHRVSEEKWFFFMVRTTTDKPDVDFTTFHCGIFFHSVFSPVKQYTYQSFIECLIHGGHFPRSRQWNWSSREYFKHRTLSLPSDLQHTTNDFRSHYEPPLGESLQFGAV